jgi:hypothetical protein
MQCGKLLLLARGDVGVPGIKVTHTTSSLPNLPELVYLLVYGEL